MPSFEALDRVIITLNFYKIFDFSQNGNFLFFSKLVAIFPTHLCSPGGALAAVQQ